MPAILLLIVVLTAVNVEGTPSCSGKIDLLFVVDGSSSICGAESCPDWDYNLEFVKRIVTNFEIGPDATRVALITISSQGNLEFNYDKYTDADSLMSAIENVAYPGGEIHSVFYITNVVTSLVKAAMSQRAGATMVAVGITDGAPSLHNALTTLAAKALHALGLIICPVCVTDRCDADTMRSAASPPGQINQTFYLVKDYSSLDNIEENLVKQICSFKGKGLLGSVLGILS